MACVCSIHLHQDAVTAILNFYCIQSLPYYISNLLSFKTQWHQLKSIVIKSILQKSIKLQATKQHLNITLIWMSIICGFLDNWKNDLINLLLQYYWFKIYFDHITIKEFQTFSLTHFSSFPQNTNDRWILKPFSAHKLFIIFV